MVTLQEQALAKSHETSPVYKTPHNEQGANVYIYMVETQAYLLLVEIKTYFLVPSESLKVITKVTTSGEHTCKGACPLLFTTNELAPS